MTYFTSALWGGVLASLLAWTATAHAGPPRIIFENPNEPMSAPMLLCGMAYSCSPSADDCWMRVHEAAVCTGSDSTAYCTMGMSEMLCCGDGGGAGCGTRGGVAARCVGGVVGAVGGGTDSICVWDGVFDYCPSSSPGNPTTADVLECLTDIDGNDVTEWIDGDCDGDGTVNEQDACVCEMGPTSNGGCPIDVVDAGAGDGDAGAVGTADAGPGVYDAGAGGGGLPGSALQDTTFRGMGGCTCRTAGGSGAPIQWLAVPLVAALLLRRRRR